MHYWAEDNYQWAQLWMGNHYEEGSGGLDQVKSTGRAWYKKAALNGSAKAQYKMAQTERHSKNAKKYYLMAAEQGHVDAMIQLIRLSRDEHERQHWLAKAMANNWGLVLTNAPLAETDHPHLTEIHINQQLEEPKEKGITAEGHVPISLFRQANSFLRHPAKDDILHKRALKYLEKVADAGYGDAALQLAQIVRKEDKASELTVEALHWYEMAASEGNIRALKELTLYFMEKPGVTVEDLAKSEEYNRQLLQKMQAGKGELNTFSQQNWMGELRDTTKVRAQLQRLGGSWQEASLQAENDPNKEYQLAKELLASRQYKSGMVRMRSAAEKGSMSARFELTVKILNGPRSFSGEVRAITDLQDLAWQSFLPACFRLGLLYQSDTGLVPKNLYLARELFLKVQADTELKENAGQRLKNGFGPIKGLQIKQDAKVLGQIEEWYSAAIVEEEDPTLLQQQFHALQNHFGDIGEMKRRAEEGDSNAQYNLAQMLQSHNLSEAMQWLQLAADNGNNVRRNSF